MRKVLSVLGVAVAASLLTVVASVGVVDAAQQVTSIFVNNDDNHPVPTKAIGTTPVTGTVSVSNFPTPTPPPPPPLWQGTPYVNSKLIINVQFNQCAPDFEIPAGQVLYVERVVASFNIPVGASGYAEVQLTAVGSATSSRVDVPSHPDGPVGQVDGNHPSYSGTLDLGLPVTRIAGCFVSSGGLVGKTAVVGYLVPAS